MNTQRSEQLYKEALELFPAGVNSPVRAFRSVGGQPLFFERGEGSKVWDADGNQYIDLCSSWGPLISGHAHPDIVAAVKEAAEKGISFGAPCAYEVELGKLLVENIPFIDKVRFVNSGTEAVMSALRLARGATGRDKIIKFNGCYHGHADHLLVKAGSGLATFGQADSAGVPADFAKNTLVAELNDLGQVEALFKANENEVAAVIIEPVPANNGLLLQTKEYLHGLKALCKQYGALLILDEVISGFRLCFGGACAHFDIEPDIVTYGKIIGGGTPVGAYGASKELMGHIAPDGPVYQAGTLSGNPLAMAAGAAQLRLCKAPDFYEGMATKTAAFADEINGFFSEKGFPMKMVHIDSIFWLSIGSTTPPTSANEIDAKAVSAYAELHRSLLEQGIYAAPSGYEVGFVSAAHSEADMQKITEAFKVGTERMVNASLLEKQ